MERYEWITLDLYDPKNADDCWKMSCIFDDDDLSVSDELLSNSIFAFLIQKQIEEKVPVYQRYEVPIGYLFLVCENKQYNVLFMNYGIIKEEWNKGFMKRSLGLLKDKLVGNAQTSELWKREYEEFLKSFIIVNGVPMNDERLNHLAVQNGNFIMNYSQQSYYEISPYQFLNQERIQYVQKAIQKIRK